VSDIEEILKDLHKEIIQIKMLLLFAPSDSPHIRYGSSGGNMEEKS